MKVNAAAVMIIRNTIMITMTMRNIIMRMAVIAVMSIIMKSSMKHIIY